MRGRFNRTICDTTTGIIVPFARVEVFEQVSGDKPDLFSVETGGLPISNPMTATALGFAGFFVAPGQYRFVASTAGGTIVSEITHEVVVDPNANDGIFENIVAETFRGREIILEDISYGRVLVRDIADNTHYAEFKYEAPGNRATLSRTGYIHFDMSPGYVGVYDQVGAPILRGETTRTRLYRGGAEVFNVDADTLKIGFSSSLDILFSDISDSVVRIKNPNGTYPLSSAGGTLSLERPDGVDVLVSNSGVTNLTRYDGGNLLTSTSSVTALYAPDGSNAFDATPTATHMYYASGNPFITAGGALGLQYENGANLLLAGSPAMVLCNPSGSGVFSASTSSTSISSPAATVLSATTTTTTIYAGNGTQAIKIDALGQSSGKTICFDVSTVADLRNISGIFSKTARTAGYTTAGDGGNGEYWLDASDTTSADNGFTVIVAADGGRWKLLFRNVADDITVRIPTDHATMQAAVDAIHGKASMAQGKIIDLKFDAGHQPTAGLLVQNGDYSYFRISSVDASVTLSSSFVGVTAESTAPDSCIVGVNAIMPILNCLINANDECFGGYVVYAGSSGFVSPNCGVIYAAKFGIYVLNNSKCEAPLANFSYCGLVNRVTTNSSLEAEGINCSNTQNRGYPDPNGDRGGLDVSRGSIVNIKSQGANITNLSNSAGNGLSVRRSLVSAEQINAANCAGVGIRAEANAVIAAGSSILTGCTYGVFASNGANVDVQGATITNCVDYAIYASRVAKISANAAICTGTTGIGRAVYATDGATIDASQSNASGALAIGYYAIHDGSINARNAVCDMTGSGAGSYAVLADYGSKINAGLGTFSNSTSGQDIRCTRGSTISASGSTGVLSKVANTLDVNGVIYK